MRYDIHPGSLCHACGGDARGFDGTDCSPCTACKGTGRKHRNGKPFYCAAEVASLLVSDVTMETTSADVRWVRPISWHEEALPDEPHPGFPGGLNQP